MVIPIYRVATFRPPTSPPTDAVQQSTTAQAMPAAASAKVKVTGRRPSSLARLIKEATKPVSTDHLASAVQGVVGHDQLVVEPLMVPFTVVVRDAPCFLALRPPVK